MRPTRGFACWACTAIVMVCLLQAAVYMGAFKTTSYRLVSRTESGSVMESLSLSLTYSRWWGRPDVRAWDPPRPAKPSIPHEEADRLKHRCNQAVDIPKVALLFLTKGDLPHKDMWTMWLRSAAGQLPTNVRYNSFLHARREDVTAGHHDAVQHDTSVSDEAQPAHNATEAGADQGTLANTTAVTIQPEAGDASASVASIPEAGDAASADASRGRSLLGALRVVTRRRLLEEDTPPAESLTVDDGVELLSNAELQHLTETVAMCQQDLDPKEDVVVQQYLFSVYLHTPPNYTMPRDPVFAPAVIQDRIFTAWGTHNLTRASKRLLAEALKEPRNRFFVLLSESCMPLYPPQTVYQQLVHSQQSRINACRKDYKDNRDVRRWTHKMTSASSGFLKRRHWRKSWQWFGLIRKHAQLVVDDSHIDEVFHNHCVPGFDPTYRRMRDCYSDEHYIPTLLAASGLESETDCTGFLNFVDWSQNDAHPMSFGASDTTLANVLNMRNQDCDGPAAIKAAASMFVTWTHFGQRDETLYTPVGGNGSDAKRYTDAYAEVVMGGGCPLFARKFLPDSSRAVLALLRDCTNKLGILSNEFCLFS